MLNPLDTYSPADTTAAQEDAYGTFEARILAFTGQDLHESSTLQMDDTDGMFDALNLPRVFDAAHYAGTTWDGLDVSEQERWDVLAAAIAEFALSRLDEDKARDAA